jgi:hypothetical protein
MRVDDLAGTICQVTNRRLRQMGGAGDNVDVNCVHPGLVVGRCMLTPG